MTGSHTVLHSSASAEWYTPAAFIEAARLVMGSITLDPASCELANQTVQATAYYDQTANGLWQSWSGNVWLNPPYGRGEGNRSNQDIWTQKLIAEYRSGDVRQAVLLVNAVPDRKWFQPLWSFPICFVSKRIHFISPRGYKDSPTHPSVLVYFGPWGRSFADVFSEFGPVVTQIWR